MEFDDCDSAFLLFFLVTVVQLSDVLQYVCGKRYGSHGIAPDVSPLKTLEGVSAAGLAATLVGAQLWWTTPFGFLGAAARSLLIVICGFLGGLVLSAVKRSLGAKDPGTMIGGHGSARAHGFSDRRGASLFPLCALFLHLTG